MKKGFIHIGFIGALFFFCAPTIVAQPTWTIDPFGKEKKPPQYEEKKLGSEKTSEKKFTLFRRILQNNISHYNFYFNANNKLNRVIEGAKIAHKDDYAQLLSFYPYSLDATAAQKIELDSVIYKATGGILIHDLRTDWVDNLYLLIGKAYYYRKLYDSAALTFQFINYNLFPRKKHEEDNRIVGANEAASAKMLSIADKEKRNIFQKVASLPPSRNDALIWLARTFTEQEQFGEAAGMINLLHDDPNLPSRLRNDLAEVTAYWFFKQQVYDSAACYLEKGLSAADNKNDRARWQFLLAQLNETSGHFDQAATWYSKAGKQSADPLMDIFAHLNSAKMLRDQNDVKELDNSIATLKKMSGRNKYESYKDIIFHSMSQLFLKKGDTANTVTYLKKSIQNNTNNLPYKNKAYLALGKIDYAQQKYKAAANDYDSVNMAFLPKEEDSAQIGSLAISLKKIANQLETIEREDSLQALAKLSPQELDLFIKKQLKQLKKEQENKEGVSNITDAFTSTDLSNAAPVDLFATGNGSGEWYFYNASLKAKGFSDFKNKWGKRENKDNWRRKSFTDMGASGSDPLGAGDPFATLNAPAGNVTTDKGIRYDALMASIPIHPEQLDSSNILLASAILQLAGIFENEIEDYRSAIFYYDNYLLRFPHRDSSGLVYMGLYHCYYKLGDLSKANQYKSRLTQEFPASPSAAMLSGKYVSKENASDPTIAAQYESIYQLFIAGEFDRAIAQKKVADSLYGQNYWTPQLLYIEAVYYVKTQKDSQAIQVLNQLVRLYPGTSLSKKSVTLIDVLKRRKEIEQHLTDLQVERVQEDSRIIVSDNQSMQVQAPATVVPALAKPLNPTPLPIVVVKDSAVKLPANRVSGNFQWFPDKPHMVLMILEKVDPVYVSESKNAFNRYNQSNNFAAIKINKDQLDAQKSLLVFDRFENAAAAFDYMNKIKRAAASEVSWLSPSMYSFIIISDDNLNLLKQNKDLGLYKQLLNNQYPGKF